MQDSKVLFSTSRQQQWHTRTHASHESHSVHEREREREFPSSVEYDEEEGESFLRGKDKEKG